MGEWNDANEKPTYNSFTVDLVQYGISQMIRSRSHFFSIEIKKDTLNNRDLNLSI